MLEFFLSCWEKSIFYNFVHSNFTQYNPDNDTKSWISSKETALIGKFLSEEIQKNKNNFKGLYVMYLVNNLTEESNSETFETICHLIFMQFKLNIYILSPRSIQDDCLNDEYFIHPRKQIQNSKQNTAFETIYLYNHQKNTILYLLKDESINKSKIKCLTDETGSGKSNIVLSFCFHALTESSTSSNEISLKNVNLIIVPHHLLRQWNDHIKEYEDGLGVCFSKLPQYTNLIDAIENNSAEHKITTNNKISLLNLKVICITNNLYEKLNENYKKIHFKRIFVDEDTQFRIKNKYDFLYYISATDKIPIKYPEYFTEKSHMDFNLKYDIKMKNILLKLNLLKLKFNFEKYYYDLTNDTINLTNEAIMNNFLSKFLKLNREYHKEHDSMKKEINLLNIKLNGYNEIIEEEKIRVSDGINSLEYINTINRLKDLNLRLVDTEKKIDENSKTISYVKEKILADTCSLCYSSLKFDDNGHERKMDYVVTKECKFAVCMSCYKMASKQKNCSFCRAEDCAVIPFLNKIERNKHDTILNTINQIVKQNPEARILIYAENVENYKIISETYVKNCIIPKGNSDLIYKLINDYKCFNTNNFKILLVNMDKMCAGLDLSVTTHLLILSDLKDQRIEHQIIGRCYRSGRTNDLYIIRILYDNETDVKSMKSSDFYKYTELFKSTDLEPIGRFFNLGDFVQKSDGLKFRQYLNDQALLNRTSYRNKIVEHHIPDKRYSPY